MPPFLFWQTRSCTETLRSLDGCSAMGNSKAEPQVAIVGAGVSGLIAALELEKRGYHPIIFDSEKQAGGRVQTDVVSGYQLDRGFQVMLEAYPMVQKYLDLQELELQKLVDGARLFTSGSSVDFGDPRRNRKLLFPTLLTNHASIS